MTTASTQLDTIGCVKEATAILGDKWTPQLLRFLANERAVRFCNLQERAEGINPRTLSARLDTLEKRGIIAKVPTTGTRCEYRLTERGRDLMPILKQMELWGEKYKMVAIN
ncbi:MAG TPA: helix-turn-helix domain-containing protein [Candidatus Saccharimonadales bacterium]|nr:helix-turn-helix domain-containing protein [Candidatus Saccharimonadales bacterium]